MNFKLLLTLIFISSGCGVKGPPKAPPGTSVPSFLDSYLGKDKLKPQEEATKKNSKVDSEADKEE